MLLAIPLDSFNTSATSVESEQLTKNKDKEGKLWTTQNTLLLIELCKNHDHEFQTKIKKYVWEKVASAISKETGTSVTAQQCDTKWKLLTSMYKQILKHNNTSGKDAKHWEYYDLMDEILHKKPEIQPEATCSTRRGLTTDNDQSK